MSRLGVLACLIVWVMRAADAAPPIEKADVFVSGEDGYAIYRIPSIIRAPNGDLLAFCEGRRHGREDFGDIDLLVKRSTDGGRTWGRQSVVWDDAENTCGNPCPVVDEKTGVVWLLATHNRGADHEPDIILKRARGTRTVWVTYSTDNGQTWAPMEEITSAVKDPAWGWYATGPGAGIQIQHGPHAGRLVIPCNHTYDDPQGDVRGGPYEHGAHVVYSDDHGGTWQLGGTVRPKANESQVAELPDGSGALLLNARSYTGRKLRLQSRSTDGGLTWSVPADAPGLVEPVCQGSLLRWPSLPASGNAVLLFSNPAASVRKNLTVKASIDGGRTWPRSLQVDAGPSAYSCLVAIDDRAAGCLYESDRPERILFVRFQPGDIQ